MNRRGFFARIASAALAGVVIPPSVVIEPNLDRPLYGLGSYLPGAPPPAYSCPLRDFVASHKAFVDATADSFEELEPYAESSLMRSMPDLDRINAYHSHACEQLRLVYSLPPSWTFGV